VGTRALFSPPPLSPGTRGRVWAPCGCCGCVCDVWHECVVILYTVARWCMRAIRPNRRAGPSSVWYPPCRRIGSARLKWSQFSATYRAYPLHETCCMACRSRLHAAVAGGSRMTLKWRSGRGHVSLELSRVGVLLTMRADAHSGCKCC